MSLATPAAFDTYVKFTAYKRHLETASYDFVKYRGKVKASYDTFLTKPDAYFYTKLSKKTDIDGRIISNLIENPKVWIKDVVSEEGEAIYLAWKKRLDSIAYHFTQELNVLNDDYLSNFEIKKGQIPHIINLVLSRELSFEVFTLLCSLANVYTYFDHELKDDVICRQILQRSRKYDSILSDIDRKKLSELTKKHFGL